MLSKFLIYGLCDPLTQELRYVGKSCSGMKRPKRHFNEATEKSSTYKDRWIMSLKRIGQRPVIVLLEEHEKAEDLPEAEVEWIAKAKDLGCRLTNLTLGGDGVLGLKGSEKHRLMLVARNKARKGFHHSEETKELLSKATKGILKPEGFREKVSEANRRRVHTEASRIKTARTLGGSPIVDENGNVYNTHVEAARTLGLCESNIRKVLNGRLKTTGGHIFRKLEIPPR